MFYNADIHLTNIIVEYSHNSLQNVELWSMIYANYILWGGGTAYGKEG